MQRRKIAVITGSTGGIGSAIADQLTKAGWNLVLVNRNEQKAKQQKATLAAAYPNAVVDLVKADLMDIAQIKAAAQTIIALHPHIDALYNNSGVLTSERVMSAQRHESNYAVNTLAAYVMTQSLRPALRRDDTVEKTMIVNTTSSAHNAAKSLETETLSDPKNIGGLTGAYATDRKSVV